MATKGKSKKSPVTKTEKQSPYSPSEIKKFIGEVQVEFSKIVWPDKKSNNGFDWNSSSAHHCCSGISWDSRSVSW
jgi:hypothetical protein